MSQVLAEYTRRCNTGGPRSRTREEQVYKTLLGTKSRIGHWTFFEEIALQFPEDVSPREWAIELLAGNVLTSETQLEQNVVLPDFTLACQTIEPLPPERVIPVWFLQPTALLRMLLILGKCSAHFYDPERPAIWTNRALVRPVRLYKPGDFYAA
jgi:hypothetical protein